MSRKDIVILSLITSTILSGVMFDLGFIGIGSALAVLTAICFTVSPEIIRSSNDNTHL